MNRTRLDQLTELTRQLQPSAAMTQAFRALRAGVDFTQNLEEHGGGNDGSIGELTWTAARDAAIAFETLERTLQRLDDLTIPF